MELLQLKYFVELAHSQHLTHTAEKMYVSPAAVSTSITRLEKELGAPLFDRAGRNIVLNSCGAIFLRYAESALSSINQGVEAVSSAREADSKALTVAMWNPIIYDPPISLFRRSHPSVCFRYVFYDPVISTDVSLSNCDFLIAPLSGFHNPEYQSELIFRDNVMLAIPPAHPKSALNSVDLYDFRDEWFIFPTDGSWSRFCKRLCREAGLEPKIRLEIDYTLRPKIVLQENAVSLTTHTAVLSGLYAGISTHPLSSPPAARPQAIFWQKGRTLTPAAREFKDFIIHYFRQFQPLETESSD